MVVLPTGPANALALVALAAYHTCAPVNATCTANELRDDACRLRAKAVFTTPEMEERLGLRSLHEDLGLEIVYMLERSGDGEVGLFDMRTIDGMSSGPSRGTDASSADRLHSLTDKSLVLHTSGTSGKKKIVPYSLRSLIVGTCAVIKSWDIHEDDVNSTFQQHRLFAV
jgi:acyl-coenzyme A synthetase/AMP-(fatty) acid ligase